jgi:hypothetical protein
MPARIQMRRTKGWRKPENVIYVGRPTRWGNPYRVEELGRSEAMRRFRKLFSDAARGAKPEYPISDLTELRGKDLACWCRVGEECHADILLELANG